MTAAALYQMHRIVLISVDPGTRWQGFSVTNDRELPGVESYVANKARDWISTRIGLIRRFNSAEFSDFATSVSFEQIRHETVSGRAVNDVPRLISGVKAPYPRSGKQLARLQQG
jgi:hypothetical protein